VAKPEEKGMKMSTFAASLLAASTLDLSDIETHVLFAQSAPSGGWLDKTTPNWNLCGFQTLRNSRSAVLSIGDK